MRCRCQLCSNVNLEFRDGVKIEVGRSGRCHGASEEEEEKEGEGGGRRQVIKGADRKE